MKSERSYFKVANKIGYSLLAIILLIAVGGIYQGFVDAHNTSEKSVNKNLKST